VLLVSGRVPRSTNSVGYGRLARPDEAPAVGIHPADAAAAGVLDGQLVEIVSEHGTLTAVARTDARLRAGVATLTHGWSTPNVASLLSATFDPLTGQPVMTAVPVRIRAA
jgi:anaerobic selenocysteine-containing dehydrogenase